MPPGWPVGARNLPGRVSARLASYLDAPELARLNQAFNGVIEPPERLAERMRRPGRVDLPVLAEMDGRAIGFASLRLVPCVFYAEPYAELTELYVEPGYRRRGAGRALMTYVEKFAREQGAANLVLLTGFNNGDGQAFYTSLGYARDDISMVKSLEKPAQTRSE